MMRTSRNKEAWRIWVAYKNSNIRSVNDAYRTRPSDAKREAEADIKEEMFHADGTNYKVISHSGFVFTCGYTVETEKGFVLVYHTKARREEILFDGGYHYWKEEA